MHESSVAKEIVDIVTEVALENELKEVSSITIELGEFSCIQKEMLSFAFQMVAEGTVMEHAVLEYEMVPAMGECLQCGRKFPITFTDKECPGCGQISETIISGLETNVKEIEGE